jgi:hypothetical protein
MSKRTQTAFSLFAERHLCAARELMQEHEIAVLSARGEENVDADKIWASVEYHLGRVTELMALHRKSIDKLFWEEFREMLDAIWTGGYRILTTNEKRVSQN